MSLSEVIFSSGRSRGSSNSAHTDTSAMYLANVGGNRDDLGLVRFAEPLDDDGGVETTRVCENDFHEERMRDLLGLGNERD